MSRFESLVRSFTHIYTILNSSFGNYLIIKKNKIKKIEKKIIV